MSGADLEARLDRALASADKPLSAAQRRALAALARDPAAWVASGTLGLLRKRGLVGKVVGRDDDGRQKTTSPVTDAGRAVLAAALSPALTPTPPKEQSK